jgi:ferredoxin
MTQEITLTHESYRNILGTNIEALEHRRAYKLICGASLTDPEIIESLSTIFSLAGANFLDITPEYRAIQAAKKGIEKAKQIAEENPYKYYYFNEPVLMLSLNVGDDPHFNTALIDTSRCNSCQQCIPECSFSAIQKMRPTGEIGINDNICYGCGKCTSICPSSAISLIKNLVDLETVLTKLIDPSITAIEIHVGTAKKETLAEYYHQLFYGLQKEVQKNILFSFSMESSLYTTKEFVEYANFITTLSPQRAIIQIDGTPMSGNTDPASSLQSIAAAQILLKNNINAYIQLAGGINHQTRTFVNAFGIDCHGIAMGTFARKLVWQYLRNINDRQVLDKALRIATSLVK